MFKYTYPNYIILTQTILLTLFDASETLNVKNIVIPNQYQKVYNDIPNSVLSGISDNDDVNKLLLDSSISTTKNKNRQINFPTFPTTDDETTTEISIDTTYRFTYRPPFHWSTTKDDRLTTIEATDSTSNSRYTFGTTNRIPETTYDEGVPTRTTRWTIRTTEITPGTTPNWLPTTDDNTTIPDDNTTTTTTTIPVNTTEISNTTTTIKPNTDDGLSTGLIIVIVLAGVVVFNCLAWMAYVLYSSNNPVLEILERKGHHHNSYVVRRISHLSSAPSSRHASSSSNVSRSNLSKASNLSRRTRRKRGHHNRNHSKTSRASATSGTSRASHSSTRR